MLQVVFTQLEDNTIKKFEKIDFKEAVELSARLEQKCREEKKKLEGNFYLIEKDSDGTAVYTGTFVFGSHYAPNLYIHIKKKLEEIKLNRQQQQDKIELMAKMEDDLPAIYKKEEVIQNAHLIDLDTSRISKLKKWQRRTIYSGAGVLLVAFVGTVFYLVMTVAQYDVAYSKSQATAKKQEQTLEMYEQGLLGDKDKLLSYFKKDEAKLTKNEKKMYAQLLLEEKQYPKVVDLYNDDVGAVATILANNDKVDLLRDFNTKYPSNEGKYDVLYWDKKYDEMLAVKDVDMTVKRSRMKTYALMKTGKLEEAKAELKNNNSSKLEAKIEEYENLTEEIKDTDDLLQAAKDSEKDEEAKTLTEKKDELLQKRESI